MTEQDCVGKKHTKQRFVFDLIRFWRSESGAVSAEFAVVASLAAALGVMAYTTTSDGSRQLVDNTGFVIGPGGPNYSVDGSGPITKGTTSTSSATDTGTTEVPDGDLLVQTAY